VAGLLLSSWLLLWWLLLLLLLLVVACLCSGIGLVLRQVYFDGYNKRLQASHVHLQLGESQVRTLVLVSSRQGRHHHRVARSSHSLTVSHGTSGYRLVVAAFAPR
jgi:hypothetical protein